MKEELRLAIEGYTKEKLILSERLGQLPTNNSTISTRSSIQMRLSEIDKVMKELLT